MATLTFEFDDTALATVIDAVCSTYGYHETVPDSSNRRAPQIPNPQTKMEFARAHVISHLNEITRNYLQQRALETVRDTVPAVTLEEVTA